MGNCHGTGPKARRSRDAPPPILARNPIQDDRRRTPAEVLRPTRAPSPPPKPTVRQHVEAVVTRAITQHMESECVRTQQQTLHELAVKLNLANKRWMYLHRQMSMLKAVVDKQRTAVFNVGAQLRRYETQARGPRVFHLRLFSDARCLSMGPDGSCYLSAEVGVLCLSRTSVSNTSFSLKCAEDNKFLRVTSSGDLSSTTNIDEAARLSFEGPHERMDVRLEDGRVVGVQSSSGLFNGGPQKVSAVTTASNSSSQWYLREAPASQNRIRNEAAILIQARFRGRQVRK